MRHPYTQALLGSIPRLEQDATKQLLSIPGLPPDLTNPPPGCRFAARCQFATDKCRAQEPPLTGDGAICSPAGIRWTARSRSPRGPRRRRQRAEPPLDATATSHCWRSTTLSASIRSPPGCAAAQGQLGQGGLRHHPSR